MAQWPSSPLLALPSGAISQQTHSLTSRGCAWLLPRPACAAYLLDRCGRSDRELVDGPAYALLVGLAVIPVGIPFFHYWRRSRSYSPAERS
jgi:hypothetical protein